MQFDFFLANESASFKEKEEKRNVIRSLFP